MGDARELIARRAALEVFPGARVNVGIGMATLVPQFTPAGVDAWFHSENGFLGMATEAFAEQCDGDLIDAGGRYVTLREGASFFDSATSFALVRGGHLDLSFLGAFEVDVHGNLANWRVPGRTTPGIGGAIELAQKVRKVIVTCKHSAGGTSKLRTNCTLPLTARGVVKLIVTDLAVLEPTGEAFRVVELAPGVSGELLQEQTAAPLVGLAEARPWSVSRPPAAGS